MRSIPTEVQTKLRNLRLQGKSILEIAKTLGLAKTTVQRYVRKIDIPEPYKRILREKQGGSKERAIAVRDNAHFEAQQIISSWSSRDHLILLIGLYWGEGTKKDFGIINSDPKLIQSFIITLQEIGIQKNRLSVSIRVHSDVSISKSKIFWSKVTGVSRNYITRVEVIEGKKKGKLRYGMCRVRVKKGIRERVLIQSCIEIIGKESNKKLVSP